MPTYGDKFYRVDWNTYELEVVTFVKEQIWPGATLPTYTLQEKDGNKFNNHISNLEYVTASENIQHSIRTGLRKNFCTGEENHRCIYKEYQIRQIFELFKTKLYTQREISKILKIPFKRINSILKGRTWKHIWKEYI